MCQEGPGGARMGQEEPGGARRSQEEPGRAISCFKTRVFLNAGGKKRSGCFFKRVFLKTHRAVFSFPQKRWRVFSWL